MARSDFGTHSEVKEGVRVCKKCGHEAVAHQTHLPAVRPENPASGFNATPRYCACLECGCEHFLTPVPN